MFGRLSGGLNFWGISGGFGEVFFWGRLICHGRNCRGVYAGGMFGVGNVRWLMSTCTYLLMISDNIPLIRSV